MTGTSPLSSVHYPAEKSDGKITLLDGTLIEGHSFGIQQPVAGEVDFNTVHVGVPCKPLRASLLWTNPGAYLSFQLLTLSSSLPAVKKSRK